MDESITYNRWKNKIEDFIPASEIRYGCKGKEILDNGSITIDNKKYEYSISLFKEYRDELNNFKWFCICVTHKNKKACASVKINIIELFYFPTEKENEYCSQDSIYVHGGKEAMFYYKEKKRNKWGLAKYLNNLSLITFKENYEAQFNKTLSQKKFPLNSNIPLYALIVWSSEIFTLCLTVTLEQIISSNKRLDSFLGRQPNSVMIIELDDTKNSKTLSLAESLSNEFDQNKTFEIIKKSYLNKTYLTKKKDDYFDDYIYLRDVCQESKVLIKNAIDEIEEVSYIDSIMQKNSLGKFIASPNFSRPLDLDFSNKLLIKESFQYLKRMQIYCRTFSKSPTIICNTNNKRLIEELLTDNNITISNLSFFLKDKPEISITYDK